MRSLPNRVPTSVVVPVAAALGGVVAVALAHKLGWGVVALALLAAFAVLALIEHPGFAVGAVVGLALLVESRTSAAFLPGAGAIYEPAIGHVAPMELLGVLMVAAVGADVVKRRRNILPEPLMLPLLLLLLAIVGGLIVGHYNGASAHAMLAYLRILDFLFVVPWAMVNVIRTREHLRLAMLALVGMAVAKSVLGLASVAAGIGVSYVDVTGVTTVLTYYDSPANFLTMTFLLGFAAAVLLRMRMPWWLWGAAPLALGCLILSYRRSFWVGAVAGGLLVILIGSQRFGRRVVLPVAGVVILALVLTLSGSVVTEQQNPVLSRVQSLNPSSLSANAQDRYRLDERRNVLAEIGDDPLTGVGLARPWRERYPLSVESSTSREYVHFAALWYWLHAGILGLAAYLFLFGAALVAAFGIWKSPVEPWIRALGLALLGGLAGLMVAETTAAFTGVDLRATITVGAALGLLAATWRVARAEVQQRDLAALAPPVDYVQREMALTSASTEC